MLLFRVVTLLVSALLLWSFINYKWWWLATYSDFSLWYQNFVMFLWIGKLAIGCLWIYLLIILFGELIYSSCKLLFKSYPVFAFYVVFALILKNQHPFSNLAVYDSFPDHSYVFIIEDQQGKIFKHGIKYKSADVIDFYDTYIENKKIAEPVGDVQLKIIGEKILHNLKIKNQYTGSNLFKVIRLKNFIENDSLKTSKHILYAESN